MAQKSDSTPEAAVVDATEQFRNLSAVSHTEVHALDLDDQDAWAEVYVSNIAAAGWTDACSRIASAYGVEVQRRGVYTRTGHEFMRVVSHRDDDYERLMATLGPKDGYEVLYRVVPA